MPADGVRIVKGRERIAYLSCAPLNDISLVHDVLSCYTGTSTIQVSCKFATCIRHHRVPPSRARHLPSGLRWYPYNKLKIDVGFT